MLYAVKRLGEKKKQSLSFHPFGCSASYFLILEFYVFLFLAPGCPLDPLMVYSNKLYWDHKSHPSYEFVSKQSVASSDPIPKVAPQDIYVSSF